MRNNMQATWRRIADSHRHWKNGEPFGEHYRECPGCGLDDVLCRCFTERREIPRLAPRQHSALGEIISRHV